MSDVAKEPSRRHQCTCLLGGQVLGHTTIELRFVTNAPDTVRHLKRPVVTGAVYDHAVDVAMDVALRAMHEIEPIERPGAATPWVVVTRREYQCPTHGRTEPNAETKLRRAFSHPRTVVLKRPSSPEIVFLSEAAMA